MSKTRSVPLLTWCVLDAAALVALRPHPIRLVRDLGAPHDWFARVGPDGAVAVLAAAGLWLTAAWFAAGLLATVAGRLPGAAGRISATVGAVLLPRVLYRIVAGSAGLGILLGPIVTAGAEQAPSAPASASASAASSASLPAPTWPSSSGSATPATPSSTTPPARPGPSATTTPSGSSAPTTQPATTHRSAHRRRSTPAPRSASGPTRGADTTDKPRSGAPAGAATVRPDDSLWLLAARRLGPGATDAQIAREWPRWYAANRGLIGDDPGLIRPGQVLQAPASHRVEGT